MSSLEDQPSTEFFPEQSSQLDPSQRRVILMLGIKQVLEKFVDATYQTSTSTEDKDKDHVLAYAKDVLSLGLLLMEFVDAIKEGDGLCILRCWRYFLPIFKASKRTNYSIEAFTFLAQHECLLTPRMQQQLLWSRTVNTRGRPGMNVPCDLHMEHINRECKNAIGSLGPNIGERSGSRIGKSIGELTKITGQFDQVNGLPPVTEKHSKRSTAANVEKLIKQVHEESQVFQFTSKRQHKKFPRFQSNITRSLDNKHLKEWMKEQLQKLVMHQQPFMSKFVLCTTQDIVECALKICYPL